MLQKKYWLFLWLLLFLLGNILSAQEKVISPAKIHSVAVQQPGENSLLSAPPKDDGHWNLKSIIKLASFNFKRSNENPKIRIVCLLPIKYTDWQVIGIKNVTSLKGIIFSQSALINTDKDNPAILWEEITFILPESKIGLKQFFTQQDSLQLIIQKPSK